MKADTQPTASKPSTSVMGARKPTMDKPLGWSTPVLPRRVSTPRRPPKPATQRAGDTIIKRLKQ